MTIRSAQQLWERLETMLESRSFSEITSSYDMAVAKPCQDCPLMDADARAILASHRSAASGGGIKSDGTFLVFALAEKGEAGDRAQERQRLVDRAVDAVLGLANENDRTRCWLIIQDGMRRAYENAGPEATVQQAEVAFRSFVDEVNGRLGQRGNITTPPFPPGVEDAIRRAQRVPPDSVFNIEIRQGGVLRIGSQSVSFNRPPRMR